MAERITYMVCPTCYQGHWTEAIDTRTMFIKDGNAVVLCPICGREFVLQTNLKCKRKNCDRPVVSLMVSTYSNALKPVAAFCSEHEPSFWESLFGCQPAVDYVADALKAACVCGAEVACSNKTNSTRCRKCGRMYVIKGHLFGPDTLELITSDKQQDTSIAEPPQASSNSKEAYEEDFAVAVAEELVEPEDKQFSVTCPNCLTKHIWFEQREQGGESETLLQAIIIMRKAEEVSKELGTSNLLNRSQGWQCDKCGFLIPHDYLIMQYSHRRL